MLAVASLAVVAWARQACGAEDGGAVFDALPEAPFVQDLRWEETSSIGQPNGSSLEGATLRLAVRVRWERIRMDARARRLRLAGRVESGSWSAKVPVRMTSKGPETITVHAKVDSIQLEVSPQATRLIGPLRATVLVRGQRRLVKPTGRADRGLRRCLEMAVHEAFVDHLPLAPGETRELRFPLSSGRRDPLGTFVVELEPARIWEHDIAFSPGRARYVEDAKTRHRRRVDEGDPVGERFFKRHVGRRPVAHRSFDLYLDTRELRRPGTAFARSAFIEVKFLSRSVEDPSALDPALVLAEPRFEPSQVYLLRIERDLSLSARELRARASKQVVLQGDILLGVAEGGGRARLRGLFTSGRFDAVASLVPAKRGEASPEASLELAGLEFSWTPGATGAAGGDVVLDAESLAQLRRAGRTGRRPGDPAELDEGFEERLRETLADTFRTALAEPRGGEWRRSVEYIDKRGRTAGKVHFIAPTREVETRSITTGPLRLQARSFPVDASWNGPADGYRRKDAWGTLSWSRDEFKPMPAQASLELRAYADDSAMPGGRRAADFNAGLRLYFEAKQLAGPRVLVRREDEPRPEPPPRPSREALPPPDFLAGGNEAEAAEAERFFAPLPPGAERIDAALEAYGVIEGEGRPIAPVLHAEIVRRLADRVDRERAASLKRFLAAASPYPVRVLAARLVSHAGALPAEERIALLAPLLDDGDPRVVRFAGHAIADLRVGASVETLIDALRRRERTAQPGRPKDRLIRASMASDLYRLLGRGASETSAGTFAATWSSLGGRLPEDPFGGERLAGPTVVAERGIFRDVRNPPVVYVLDASSSMKDAVRVSRPLIEDLRRTGIPLEDQGDGMLRKVDVVRADLASTLESFADGVPFRIVVFNDRAVSHPSEIVALSPESRRSALDFLRAIEIRHGTDIFRGLSEAFETPAMASLCILSDGNPSRGLEGDAIDRQVFRWNYLRGVRIIALSFARDVGDDDNLCSVLARRNFGWVRVLDLTEPPPVERVDPVAHEELPGLPFGRRSLFRPTAWRRN